MSLATPGVESHPHHSRQLSTPVHHPGLDPQASSDPIAHIHPGPYWSPTHKNTGPSGGFFTSPRKPKNHHPIQSSMSHPQAGFESSHLQMTGPSLASHKHHLREHPPAFARQRERLKSRSFDDLNSYIAMSGLSVPQNNGVTNNTFEMEEENNNSYTENPTNLVYTYTTNNDMDLSQGPEAWRNVHTAPKGNGVPSTVKPTVKYAQAIGTNDLRKTKSNPSLVVGRISAHSPPHTYESPPSSPLGPSTSAARNFTPLALQPAFSEHNIQPNSRPAHWVSNEANFNQVSNHSG